MATDYESINNMSPCQVPTFKDRTATDLLNHIYSGVPHGTWFELTYILPPEYAGRGPSPLTESYRLGYDGLDWEHIQNMNDNGYSVYYSLTAKSRRTRTRASEKDAAWCSVLWADVDLHDGHFLDLDAAHAHLCLMRPAPTAMVFTGGGWHALWRITPVQVDDTTLPRIKQTLRGLALASKGDRHVAELARIFRLPDTINTKPQRNGALCFCDDVFTTLEYELDDFASHYHAGAMNTRPSTMRPLPDGVQLSLPRWCQDYLAHGAPQGERNNRLFAAAVEYKSNGYSRGEAERDLVSRAMADGLNESEAMRTIDSAWRSSLGSLNVPSHLAAMMAVDDGENES